MSKIIFNFNAQSKRELNEIITSLEKLAEKILV